MNTNTSKSFVFENNKNEVSNLYGPAIIEYKNDIIVAKKWFKDGINCRDNGASVDILIYDDSGMLIKMICNDMNVTEYYQWTARFDKNGLTGVYDDKGRFVENPPQGFLDMLRS